MLLNFIVNYFLIKSIPLINIKPNINEAKLPMLSILLLKNILFNKFNTINKNINTKNNLFTFDLYLNAKTNNAPIKV